MKLPTWFRVLGGDDGKEMEAANLGFRASQNREYLFGGSLE